MSSTTKAQSTVSKLPAPPERATASALRARKLIAEAETTEELRKTSEQLITEHEHAAARFQEEIARLLSTIDDVNRQAEEARAGQVRALEDAVAAHKARADDLREESAASKDTVVTLASQNAASAKGALEAVQHLVEASANSQRAADKLQLGGDGEVGATASLLVNGAGAKGSSARRIGGLVAFLLVVGGGVGWLAWVLGTSKSNVVNSFAKAVYELTLPEDPAVSSTAEALRATEMPGMEIAPSLAPPPTSSDNPPSAASAAPPTVAPSGI